MTDHLQLRLRYALLKNTDRESRFVDDVETGLKCNCVCPCCGKEVVAKNQGKKKEHHFAHTKGADCAGARMTDLHMLAQNVLEEKKQVLLPPYNGTYYQNDPILKTFDHIDLEGTCKNEDSTRRPDCIRYNEGKAQNLWIEIYCRHKIDDAKKEDIINRKQYCIEIDFSDLLKTNYSKEDVEHRLIEDSSHSKWICCPAWDDLEERGRLKEEEELREQQRLEEEERQRELARIKEEREHDEYLEQLSNMWRSNSDQSIADNIIKEIKRNPYPMYSANQWSMYDHLVPWSAWAREYTRFPRNENGLQVFNCLIRYYYNKIKLDDRNHTRWRVLDTPMWKLLNKKERSDEENVLLEYMIVIWAINLLNNHKHYSDHDSELAKTFSKNANIRKGLMEIMLQGGDRNRFLEEDVREQIMKEYEGKEDGETIVQIFQICFPIITRKNIEQSQQEPLNEPERQLYGHDKILAEHHMSETEAWEELNRMFKEQENQRKNNE